MSDQILAVEESPSVQVQSVSTDQEALQPSLGFVLPSSQYPEVGIITLESPQISVQTLEVEESPNVQVQPVSTPHVELHPSPFTEFPSSQYPARGFITLASPHISFHTLAVDESPSVQVQPDSTAQLASQPSFIFEFPSSQ